MLNAFKELWHEGPGNIVLIMIETKGSLNKQANKKDF